MFRRLGVTMRNRAAIIAIGATVAVAAIGICLSWRAFDRQLPLRLPGGPTCVVDPVAAASANASRQGGSAGAGAASATSGGEPVDLDDQQAANASTISAVAIRRGMPSRAIVVALATALQESKLHNLQTGDRDSVGLFQQRPSQGWGTREQLADPRFAANAFYTALLKVRGWQRMRVTDAAQAVQHSAHPEAYQKWAAEAEVLTLALAGDAPGSVACTVADKPAVRGAAAAAGLATGLRLDWGNVSTTAEANPVGVSLAAHTTRTGWQYAHWLVAHAQEHGIRSVHFGGLRWTARGGTWTPSTPQSGGAQRTGTSGTRVVAEVYPE